MVADEKRALVLGSNGQDGSYLVEHLLRRGYVVFGLARSESRLAAHPRFHAISFDLRQTKELPELTRTLRPSSIFHVAAVHGRAGTPYEAIWQDMLSVNVGSVHAVLEYLRESCPEGVLIYAGSSKVFGPVLPSIVTEESPIFSSCLYTVTKNAARDLISYYRQVHGIPAAVMHLFQHESERRGAEYFVPKLVGTLARVMAGHSTKTEFGSLDFFCDWGSASEYMDIAVDLAEYRAKRDVILATGETWKARDFAEQLFAKHGLNYRDYILEKPGAGEIGQPFKVMNGALKNLIGRVPHKRLMDVCDSILEAYQKREKLSDLA